MKKLRVVQYGTWKYTHSAHTMRCLRNLPELYDVAGLCEPDEARWREASREPWYCDLRRYTREEILSDSSIDAVIVETNELTQADDALPFVERGLPVHVDKPCGAGAASFEKLVRTAQARGVPFQSGYMYRYNPAIRRAVDLVKSGEIGEVLNVEAQMSQRYGREMLDSLNPLPGGMMFYLGCHLIDLLVWIQGEPQAVLPCHTATGIEGSRAQDAALALFRYPRGVSIVKSVASEVGSDARRQLTITGTEGTIEIRPLEEPVDAPGLFCANRVSCRVTRRPHPAAFDQRAEVTSFPPFGRYDAMMTDFAKIVRGEKRNEFSAEHELAVHRTLLMACQNAAF